jgi:hypothetical protein
LKSQSISQYLPTLRYFRLHLHVDRILCYDRALLAGLFKARITLICPTSQRMPVSWESDRAFASSTCLRADEGTFHISVPINTKGPPNQLKEWRVEFEVLHKYPAAPIYSVVARSWADPVTLVKAQALDLYSTHDIHSVSARVNFRQTACSPVSINLFRTVARAIVAVIKLARLLADSRKNEIKLLDRQIRLLDSRSKSEQQRIQNDLMLRTIETMNKYIESGSKPDDWVRALHRGGLLGDDSNKILESQISSLREQVEMLRNDVLKSVIERPTPVINISTVKEEAHIPKPSSWLETIVSPRSPEIPKEPPPKAPTPPVIKSGSSTPQITASKPSVASSKPASSQHTPESTPVKKFESVKSRMLAKSEHQEAQLPSVPLKKIPQRAVPPPPVNDMQPDEENGETEEAAENVEEPAEIVDEVIDEPAEVPVADYVSSAVTNTFNSWWGAVASAVAPSAEPVPPAIPVKSIPKAEPVPRKISTAPLVRAMTSGKLTPAKKVVVTKPIPKKSASGLKAKVDPVQAKAEMLTKLKMVEAKRKAEIAAREKAILEFSSKLPPVDKSRFLGLPGPPPFAPKAKAKSAQQPLLPTELEPEKVDDDALEDTEQ